MGTANAVGLLDQVVLIAMSSSMGGMGGGMGGGSSWTSTASLGRRSSSSTRLPALPARLSANPGVRGKFSGSGSARMSANGSGSWGLPAYMSSSSSARMSASGPARSQPAIFDGRLLTDFGEFSFDGIYFNSF